MKQRLEEEHKQLVKENDDRMKQFKEMGITMDMIENAGIEDKGTLIQMKFSLRTKFETTMTNVLRLALNQFEETLACIITAYYEFCLDEEMLVKALSNDQFDWLMFVWAFRKNFIGARGEEGCMSVGYQQLMGLIKKQHQFTSPDQIEVKTRQILDWKLMNEDDNILQSLLYYQYN
mmetsp:Transcript_23322/g.22952  ORF Transcript_23322/g.22952 Transcript_23322/m.22952 type:complete len:176 (+) Transcript_23322:2240-2767(+)